MDWQELNKTRVADLREMMKEHLPEVTGVVAKKKEELIDLLADKLEIERPQKIVTDTNAKVALKTRIQQCKELRQAALEAHDHVELKKQRRVIHRLKHQLRRMANQ